MRQADVCNINFVVDVATSCHACVAFLPFVILEFRLVFLSFLSTVIKIFKLYTYE
jgi:hypothetical protein